MATTARVKVPWHLAIPFLAVVILFWAVPLSGSFRMSLQSNGFGSETWVGLTNYQALFSDARYGKALLNTSLIAAGTILIILPFGMLIAHLLNKASGWIRHTVSFGLLLPALTPPLILALLFVQIFSGDHGILNTLLGLVGIKSIDWLKDATHIKQALLIQATWRWTGFITLFLLAGLRSIPSVYYDAARAEGANVWQTFYRVTLPLMKNVLLFLGLFLLLDAFVLFEGAYYLLGASGGTSDVGLLLVAYTYDTGFKQGAFGTAAAMSFLIVPVLAAIIFAVTQKWRRVT